MKTSRGVTSRRQACILLRGGPEWLPLSSEDMAFAVRMYRESVVWRKRIDHAIGRYTNRSLDSLDPDVVCSLRIGAVQLLVLRTPPHAALSSTVEAHKNRRSRGLVNAVLRKIARHTEEKLPLHVYYSHPEELVGRWIRRYGKKETEALLRWNNQPPPLGGYAFGEIPSGTQQGHYLERYRLIERGGALSLPDGLYVQDEAAALVGRGMAMLPGSPVLETGAAPGGKTAHLNGSAAVFSIDVKESRMQRWTENAKRLGWKNCFPVVASTAHLPFGTKFGKVVLDAPCTNTGVYRRRFDARWNWTPSLERKLVGVQRKMLQESSSAVENGGVLVYSTCSMEPAENTGVVGWFEQNNHLFERIPFPAPDSLLSSEGFLSIFPPESGLDGLFAAAWKKRN